MLKVFEDKLTIAWSEFEEYTQLKLISSQLKERINSVDKLTSNGDYSVATGKIRLALGLGPVEEQ